ncbi:hypothetical protein IZ6_03730 [Terrihabitans soli]|uniref:Uncharacterized protein n=1 Tax=Terrihabitans soli TaxID=708113 RepID=A0A6S6QT65_9HYPH|nr:hypothetical protein [Terrihabitans soli]BCJ89638.1 hypothetical protein IZ6_03730 [Terrihabitans soli]
MKEFFALAAMAMTGVAFGFYIWQILRGEVRPHAISWLTWGVATIAVFAAQIVAGGGPGAWHTGFSGTATILVFGLTVWKCGFDRANAVDWTFFAAALLGLALWRLTDEPFTAVAIMSTIDVLGNGPTVRKVMIDPFGESPTFFGSIGLRTTLAIAALETYSATTVLFPASVGIASVMVAILILFRRRLAAAA